MPLSAFGKMVAVLALVAAMAAFVIGLGAFFLALSSDGMTAWRGGLGMVFLAGLVGVYVVAFFVALARHLSVRQQPAPQVLPAAGAALPRPRPSLPRSRAGALPVYRA